MVLSYSEYWENISHYCNQINMPLNSLYIISLTIKHTTRKFVPLHTFRWYFAYNFPLRQVSRFRKRVNPFVSAYSRKKKLVRRETRKNYRFSFTSPQKVSRNLICVAFYMFRTTRHPQMKNGEVSDYERASFVINTF